MPRFFFDLFDDELTSQDQTGIDLPDEETARSEATRTLTEIAGQELPHDGAHREFKIVVSDSERKVLFQVQLDFNMVEGGDSDQGEDSGDRD